MEPSLTDQQSLTFRFITQLLYRHILPFLQSFSAHIKEVHIDSKAKCNEFDWL